ncbi:MAG TPA: hypothetical protein VGB50_09280 [Flavobacterium sp.]|jgi:hypothetical protein
MKKAFFTKYAVYLVPAIMTFFFARNLVYTTQYNMDSWMGGGMRMFGAVDKMLYRVAGFTANIDDKSYFVNFRNIKSFEGEDAYLRVMPKDDRLEKVKKRVEATNWCLNQATGEIRECGKKLSSGFAPINGMKVSAIVVYKPVFDRKSKKVSLTPIKSYPK